MKWLGLIVGLLLGLVAMLVADIPAWLVYVAVALAGFITYLAMSPAASLLCALGVTLGFLLGLLILIAPALMSGYLNVETGFFGHVLGGAALLALLALVGTGLGAGLMAVIAKAKGK